MIRLLLFLVSLGSAAVALAWFADQPGTITIDWLGYELSSSMFAAVLALVAMMALLLLAAWLVLRIMTAPRRLGQRIAARRRARGMDALRQGLFALGAGDAVQAAAAASVAQKALPGEPLTALLRAEAARANGDRGSARRIYETLADSPPTRALALRGLYRQALAEGELTAARHFAETAAKNGAGWALDAQFSAELQASDFAAAAETVLALRSARRISRVAADRRRAVLLTALAQSRESSAPAEAAELAMEAHKLAPDLIPAAVLAGKLAAGQGHTGRASRIVARAWLAAPHPDLATVYAFARAGDSPRDRLTRIRTLAALAPDAAESRIALATAALVAREWGTARQALEPLASAGRPIARTCLLMARLEAGESGDRGAEREWLARAVHAPRGPAWVADGVAAAAWAPLSPGGHFDAFVWRDGGFDEGRPAIDGAELMRETPSAEPIHLDAPQSADGVSRPAPRREPQIFIAGRAPDDPGLGASSEDDLDIATTPLRPARLSAPEH